VRTNPTTWADRGASSTSNDPHSAPTTRPPIRTGPIRVGPTAPDRTGPIRVRPTGPDGTPPRSTRGRRSLSVRAAGRR